MNIETDILIIGGGFAGVSAAQELEKQGISTTLVDKKNYFEVTFATLRNITDPIKTKNKARKKYQDFLKGNFIQGSVVEMSANTALLADGSEIKFEQGIIASGTRYPSMPAAKTNNAMDIDSRNDEFHGFHEKLKLAEKVLIVGGGVVGVELAGEIAYAMPKIQVSLAHNSSALLNGYKKRAQRKSLEQLKKLGVEVLFNRSYEVAGDKYIDKESGLVSDADLVFKATGVLPNNEFLMAKMGNVLNDYGYVRVNETLEVAEHSNLYALGDIADVGEAKLGYLAQEQGEYLAKTIVKRRKGQSTKGYKRNPLMALIPVGQKKGVVQLPFAVTTLGLIVGMKQKDLFISKIYKAFGTNPN